MSLFSPHAENYVWIYYVLKIVLENDDICIQLFSFSPDSLVM